MTVRLVERRVARLVEDRVTEIQAEAQNSIEKVNRNYMLAGTASS